MWSWHSDLSFTYSNSTIKTLALSKKYVQRKQRQQNNVWQCCFGVFIFKFSTLHIFHLVNVFIVAFGHVNAKWGLSCCDLKSRQKAWYALKNMENHKNFSSLELTPSFPWWNWQYPKKPLFRNLDIDISALGSASELACEYNYSLLQSINHLKSSKLALYIFIKHVTFNKVVTYRFEACEFVWKGFAKTSRRKFLVNWKRATAEDLCRKSSVMESFLMKLLRWTLDLQL